MALSRKSLKAMGLTDEQVDSIVEMHTETVDGLKNDLEKYKADAKNLPSIQKQLEKAQEDLKTAQQDGWKDKHDKVKKEFDDYKKGIEAKATLAAKEKAVRAYLESKSITGSNLSIAMRGLNAEIDAAELDGDKLKDTKVFDDLIAGDLKGLVTVAQEKGAPSPANPPHNAGGTMTKDEIMKIKDPTERQTAIANNITLFRKEP